MLSPTDQYDYYIDVFAYFFGFSYCYYYIIVLILIVTSTALLRSSKKRLLDATDRSRCTPI